MIKGEFSSRYGVKQETHPSQPLRNIRISQTEGKKEGEHKL